MTPLLATGRASPERHAPPSQASPPRRDAALAWRFLTGSVLVVVAITFGPVVARVPLGIGANVAAVIAIGYGTFRVADRADRTPWRWLWIASLLFLAGASLRVTVSGAGRLPDMLVIPGYLAAAYAFAGMLVRRRADRDDPAWIDAVLVGVTFACLEWTYQIAPSFGDGDPPLLTVVTAFLPAIDVVLLLLIGQQFLSGGLRSPALWLLVPGIAGLLTADLIAATHPGPAATLYASTCLMTGAATLHPSMRQLTRPSQALVRRLSRKRMVGLGFVLLVPVIVATVEPAGGPLDQNVRGVLVALLVGTVLLRVVRSNDSRARAENTVRRRATHDALTDLPNRELLSDTITAWGERATADQQEISLLFLDLDRFKMINDHWGHQVGDELLCAVAARLSANVRGSDLVCRIGGDEFVIALASPSHSILAESVATRALGLFTEPFTLSVGDVVVSASIGVAKAGGGAEAVELIRDADTAMYKAKDSGRNAYALFDTSLRDELRDRITLEQQLRGALARGELYAAYQPIVDVATGELDGFETLMRWEHPQLGLVSPLRFIPVAEETGLIVEAGTWLLRESAAQLAVWRAGRRPGDRPLHISVNVSVRQLTNRDLVAVVQDILTETGLPPGALWLEITESGVMEDIDTALATLDELRDLGVTMAIDDFGTGYSSLSYLNRLPVGIVKLDRSFINDVGRHGANESIVRAVLAMAAALNLRVVAEGVETELQRDWLCEQGCDLAQGWLFGKPLRASETVL
ncbi:EAL domain-containing protein [Actinoplanes sp. NBRC 101535]|uniref:putative bifunctional diguanylate cyclase/phosphodiesterase n=1 Tax=Actinoplanes sp. NBRC 101535 TaxID=3032196 RepID=UPI0024A0EBFB|nr:EAL domain-containing protein [Actinoplanes sp. NBRC 101535]GLY05415.1 hypothetical protein Acsp01_57940 [Actinoplanes sp. NBRC 101535]